MFDSNTDVKTCDVTCCGQNVKSIETKEQIRGSIMLAYSAPTPIPAVTVQVSGGGFVAGEILTKYDPCTNKNTKDGCVNYRARGSIAGCTGIGAKACLGGNFFWSRKKCVNEPTKTCYGGGFFVEACFLWRCYRWWFWQESKCSNE